MRFWAARPLSSWEGNVVAQASLSATRVSRTDLDAELGETNAIDPNISTALVLEATGNISALHGDALGQNLLAGLRRY
jgi:hypothetical protein